MLLERLYAVFISVIRKILCNDFLTYCFIFDALQSIQLHHNRVFLIKKTT